MTAQNERKSMYLNISEKLREAIRDGRFPDGRLPTERVLGVRHDVSVGTVRKALDLLEQEGIILRRRGSGTYIRRRLHAQPQIGSRRTHLICHLSGTGTEGTIGNFFNRLMLAVQGSVESSGYATVVAGVRDGKLPMPILKQKVDGVVLAGTYIDRDRSQWHERVGRQVNNTFVTRVVDVGLPVVTINNRTDCQTVHSVFPDYDHAVREALEHLKALGHQHVAMYGGPRFWPAYGERFDAFLKHTEQLGLDSGEHLCGAYQTWAYMDPVGAMATVTNHLRKHPEVTAAIVAAGNMGIVTQAAENLGYKVPEQMSVLGFTDIPRSEANKNIVRDHDLITPPDATTLEMPVHALADKAIDRLMALIEGRVFPPNQREIYVPPIFTPGNTTAPPRGGD